MDNILSNLGLLAAEALLRGMRDLSLNGSNSAGARSRTNSSRANSGRTNSGRNNSNRTNSRRRRADVVDARRLGNGARSRANSGRRIADVVVARRPSNVRASIPACERGISRPPTHNHQHTAPRGDLRALLNRRRRQGRGRNCYHCRTRGHLAKDCQG